MKLTKKGQRTAVRTPATAMEIIPGLSLGAALNYWVDGPGHDFAWREIISGSGGFGADGEIVETFSHLSVDRYQHFRGLNGTFGVLWEILPRVAVGGVWKTPFVARVTHLLELPSDPSFPPFRGR